MSTISVAKVLAKREVANDIFAFKLKVVGAGHEIASAAGAHIDVHLPSGLVRQYSLTGLTGDALGQLTIAVFRDVNGRGGSLELCDTIAEGDELRVSEPKNNFKLDLEQQHYRLLGGGIGLTPVLHMAITLHDQGKEFQLDICARTRASVPFLDYLQSAPFADRVSYHFSEEPGSMRLDLSRYIAAVPVDAQLYACGPERMLEDLTRLAADWPLGRLRTERFANVLEDLAGGERGEFRVELARSGAAFTVAEESSILDLLKQNGILRDASCLEGVCGTCITTVLSGDIIHRDACLYDEEKADNSLMAICVSRGRPGTTVVLDI